MDITPLIKGIVLGFSIAAPVGPIGILCIRRTLAQGRAAGFISGLGAATADACYCSIAGFGLGFLSSLFLGAGSWLNLAGSLFICYLGVATLFARPPAEGTGTSQPTSLWRTFFSALLLTLSNPITILSFAAIYTSMQAMDATQPAISRMLAAGLLVTGVFSGSALWWLTLSSFVGLVRHRFTPHWLLWTNRVAGAVLLGYGLVALARVSL
ncbi:MAG: LysE family translocator [Anaerolineae bacterium]